MLCNQIINIKQYICTKKTMAGNSFGNIFKLTTFGESHGLGIGGVIDGCPSGVKIDLKMIQNEFYLK